MLKHSLLIEKILNNNNTPLLIEDITQYNIVQKDKYTKYKAIDLIFLKEDSELSYITPEQIEYLIFNSLQHDELFHNEFIFLAYNKRNIFNLSSSQWSYIIEKSNLEYTTYNGNNFLLHLLSYFENHTFTPQQLSLITKRSNTFCINNLQQCALSIMIESNTNYHDFFDKDLKSIILSNYHKLNCFLSVHILIEEKIDNKQNLNIQFLETLFDTIKDEKHYKEKLLKYSFLKIINLLDIHHEKNKLNLTIATANKIVPPIKI